MRIWWVNKEWVWIGFKNWLGVCRVSSFANSHSHHGTVGRGRPLGDEAESLLAEHKEMANLWAKTEAHFGHLNPLNAMPLFEYSTRVQQLLQMRSTETFADLVDFLYLMFSDRLNIWPSFRENQFSGCLPEHQLRDFAGSIVVRAFNSECHLQLCEHRH